MTATTDGPPLDILHQQLKEGLAAAEAQELEAQANVDSAKAALAAAKGEAKKLRTMIELYVGKTSAGSTNKQSVRPLVEQCLAGGPLKEDVLRPQLEAAMKAKGLPLTGLALVLRSLRNDFVSHDGRWALEASEKNEKATQSHVADNSNQKRGEK